MNTKLHALVASLKRVFKMPKDMDYKKELRAKLERKDEMVEFTFANQSHKEILIWTEPAAIEIAIPPQYEYRLITDDKEFVIEFNNDGLIFWLQTKFHYKLLKRPISSNPKDSWEIEID